MSLKNAINALLYAPINSLAEAQDFLKGLPIGLDSQVIGAIYLGRSLYENSHNSLPSDFKTTADVSQIAPNDYANILFEKSSKLELYLNKLLECAEASGEQLNEL